jgi:hypothetical protein
LVFIDNLHALGRFTILDIDIIGVEKKMVQNYGPRVVFCSPHSFQSQSSVIGEFYRNTLNFFLVCIYEIPEGGFACKI